MKITIYVKDGKPVTATVPTDTPCVSSWVMAHRRDVTYYTVG